MLHNNIILNLMPFSELDITHLIYSIFSENLLNWGLSINELLAIWKLFRNNQLKISSHKSNSWRVEEIEGVQTSQGLASPSAQTEARAHCSNRMPAVQPEKTAQLWSPKGFSRTPSGRPCTSMQGSPNKYQRPEQQEFLPTAHSWSDTLRSKYFPDVKTQFAGRSASGARGTCLSLLKEEGVWLVSF